MAAITRPLLNAFLQLVLITLIATPIPSLAQTETFKAPKYQICIQNRTDKPLLLTAEAIHGQRKVEMVATNQTICVDGGPQAKGTVGAFEDINALEGCSRLATTGKTQVLLAYASFDNCTWAD